MGCVTAACCARHHQVTGLDFEPENVSRLKQGKAPLFEPGLDELIASGLQQGRLQFSDNPQTACADADILWLTYDTPVNDKDESDVSFVLERLGRCLPHLPHGALVLISSQVPVGTCARLEAEFTQFHFAYLPENLRLGRALDAFEKAERVVIGIRNQEKRRLLEDLFAPFTQKILWMRTESAEMVKHGINSFLALSITFINELARLCEQTGADATEVSLGLKSDVRIGPRAYLGPGGAFAGGTLARDVVTLTQLAAEKAEPVFVIPAIKQSNDQHRDWAFRKLVSRLGSLNGKTIAILGLTYTPNTDTLRRSLALELSRKLIDAGASVKAYDPAIKQLPLELSSIRLGQDVRDVLNAVDAGVVCTEWPEFRRVEWASLVGIMRRALFVDANRFLEKELQGQPVEHLSVGRS